MKIPSLKDNFATHIRERGLDYHKRRRVRDLLIDKDTVTATVLGNRNYRVRINLKSNSMKCTCPCDFNCKHEAAVLYALRSNKNVEKVDDILKELNKKTKKSLIELIHKMISTEPKFKSIVSDNPKNILKQIEQLDLEDYGGIDSLIEEVDIIHESITEKGNNLDLLISLFKEFFLIWQVFGYKDRSNHGKYIYWRNGLLSKMALKRLARGVILTDVINDGEVLRALKKVGAKKITRHYLTVNRVVE